MKTEDIFLFFGCGLMGAGSVLNWGLKGLVFCVGLLIVMVFAPRLMKESEK